MKHEITRHRHDVKRRLLTVREKTRISPAMIRILFEGDALADFTSLSPDDHVKLILPGAGEKPDMRDYTPRRFDRDSRTLTIDFAVHDAGPATDWAVDAAIGDTLEIGGPRGSVVVPQTFDWWLLIGDETALPAIGRYVEQLPEGAHVTTLVAITGSDEIQTFETAASHRPLWVHRPLDQADDAAPLLAALESVALPDGDGFVWIAAEAGVARTLRSYMVDTRHHPLNWMKAAGYWRKGVADGHEKLDG